MRTLHDALSFDLDSDGMANMLHDGFDFAKVEAWLTDAQDALVLLRQIEATTGDGAAAEAAEEVSS